MSIDFNTLNKIVEKLNQRFFDSTNDSFSPFSFSSTGYVWCIMFYDSVIFNSEDYSDETPDLVIRECVLAIRERILNTKLFLNSCVDSPLTFE